MIFRKLFATILLCIGAIVVGVQESSAQEGYYSIRPALLGEENVSFGARWDAGLEPGRSVHLALAFPREWWWGVRARGAVAALSRLNNEPLLNGAGDIGVQVLLLKQRPCLPDDCEDLVDFDLGYVVLGIRGITEVDQGIDEGSAGAGGFIMYRPLGLQHSLWPLMPTISVAYTVNRPVTSVLRDALSIEKSSYRNLQVEAIWHILFAREWVPQWLQPGRLDVTLNGFQSYGLGDAAEDVYGSTGHYAAVDLGYELNTQVPWIRHVFLRGSRGRHQIRPESRRTWMIGVVIGETR